MSPLVKPADHLEFWQENGYLILEDILSPAQLKEARAESERIVRDRGGDSRPIQYPHKLSPFFLALMKNRRIVETVELLIGSKVDALQTWMYFKPPGELGRDVHQNSFYTRAERNKIINVSTAIDDSDEENGCLYMYPGSQVEPILPIVVDEARARTNPDLDGFRNERGKAPIVPEEYLDKKIYLPLRAGSSILIHSHVLHGSEENRSRDRMRRAFLTGYLAQGAEFRAGEQYKRQRINVYD